jgi:hypothetical protein
MEDAMITDADRKARRKDIMRAVFASQADAAEWVNPRRNYLGEVLWFLWQRDPALCAELMATVIEETADSLTELYARDPDEDPEVIKVVAKLVDRMRQYEDGQK